MTITRRLFLQGSSLAVLAAPAIGMAAERTFTETPFLPAQQGDAAYLMSVVMRPPRPTLTPFEIAEFYSGKATRNHGPSVCVQRMWPTPSDAVRCAVEAEERIFSAALHRHDERASRGSTLDDYDPLNCVVVSNCNVIGSRNRQGPASVVGMHPRLAERLTLLEPQPTLHVGRWQRIGRLLSIHVFVSEHLPVNEFVCAANGTYWSSQSHIYGAAVLLESGGRRFLLSPPSQVLDEGRIDHALANYVSKVTI